MDCSENCAAGRRGKILGLEFRPKRGWFGWLWLAGREGGGMKQIKTPEWQLKLLGTRFVKAHLYVLAANVKLDSYAGC